MPGNEQQHLNHPGRIFLNSQTETESLSPFDITIHKLVGSQNLGFRTDWFTHVSTSHLGNKSTWYDDRRAQRHNVVLESKDDGISCMFQIIGQVTGNKSKSGPLPVSTTSTSVHRIHNKKKKKPIEGEKTEKHNSDNNS